MVESVDLLLCDPQARTLLSETANLRLKIAVASDYYTLFSSIHSHRPKVIAGAMQGDLWPLEDFCIHFKNDNPAIPLFFYGDQISEHQRLPLMELGADDVVSRRQILPTIERTLRSMYSGEKSTPSLVELPRGAVEPQYDSLLPFDDKDLSHVLHFVASGRKTGMMEIRFFGKVGERGSVYATEGRITHASYEGTEGIPALARMMRQGAGKVGLLLGKLPPRETIQLPLDHVLIEATVQADEVDAPADE
ncbi:MAG: DUF4388 domain-containing protein [Candidatus Sumerlaeia bacterium]|nr:DUF4388 domain-containing protein [Candidatus Sumerlaeia bacterium]